MVLELVFIYISQNVKLTLGVYIIVFGVYYPPFVWVWIKLKSILSVLLALKIKGHISYNKNRWTQVIMSLIYIISQK